MRCWQRGYFQERYERGRQDADRAWLAWYERMRAAQAEGKPFDEPPPVRNGKGGE